MISYLAYLSIDLLLVHFNRMYSYIATAVYTAAGCTMLRYDTAVDWEETKACSGIMCAINRG